MDIIPGVEIVDLALYIVKSRILAVSDLHIGYEEALNKQGFLVPRFQFKELESRLSAVIIKTNPCMIIVNGDIKHEFGEISEQEWRDALKILDLLSLDRKVVLVRGNHDTILGPIARKRSIEVKESFVVDDIFFVHGDRIVEVPAGVKTVIIGHEHPALSLRENARIETFKCFLKGKFKKWNLIVMPSYNIVTEGTDILKEKLLSPFLQDGVQDFEVYVVEGKEVLCFGRVSTLKS
ncbi:MAG: metallophosphoesterase [Candidatus Woesearchaeota archaeon]